MTSLNKRETKAAACPTCGKAPDKDHIPFCSKRCADVDLHRWLAGSYALPAEDGGDADAAGASDDE